MNNHSEIFKEFQEKFDTQINHQKTLFLEQHKNSLLYIENLHQKNINYIKQFNDHIQQQVQDNLLFQQNLSQVFQQQPFDIKKFFESVTDYQSKQLEMLEHMKKENFQHLNMEQYHPTKK